MPLDAGIIYPMLATAVKVFPGSDSVGSGFFIGHELPVAHNRSSDEKIVHQRTI
jgi:hypothetical protein